jgi:hypothetical protein
MRRSRVEPSSQTSANDAVKSNDTIPNEKKRRPALLSLAVLALLCLPVVLGSTEMNSARNEAAPTTPLPRAELPPTELPPTELALVDPNDTVQLLASAGPPIPVRSDTFDALPFSIRGTATTRLAPGISSPLKLEIDNPNTSAIVIDSLLVSFVGTTACDGPTNFETVRPFIGALVVKPGRTQLSEAVAPKIAMRNLPRSQDACKTAKISLRFAGAAHK